MMGAQHVHVKLNILKNIKCCNKTILLDFIF
jgi:hypothetical protein